MLFDATALPLALADCLAGLSSLATVAPAADGMVAGGTPAVFAAVSSVLVGTGLFC